MSQVTSPYGLRQRQPRVTDRKYKGWIAQLPCVICATVPVEVAHLRYADVLYLKDNPGMGAKPSDLWTLPLCAHHHRLGKNAQHSGNERNWWRCRLGRESPRDPHALCLILRFICHPDVSTGERVLSEWRNV